MGAEIILGAMFWVAASLGLAVATFNMPVLTAPEPAGIDNPRVEVAADVRTILDQWENAGEGVKGVRISTSRLLYDETFKTVRISQVQFESSNPTHWSYRVFPTSVEKNQTTMVRNQQYHVQSNTPEEWSADGEQLHHRDFARQESQSISLSSFPDPSLILESHSAYRLFVGFSAAEFLGRFNVRRGELENSDGQPVHHLVFEPHAEGAAGKFLRHAEKLEVILDASTLELKAIKEVPRSGPTCVYRLVSIELAK